MRRLAPIVSLALIAVLAVPAVSADQEKDEVEAKIAELAAAIRSQQGKQTEVQAEITASEERMREVSARLAEAIARLEALEDQVRRTQQEYDRLVTRAGVLERQIAETRIELRATRTILRTRAVELYVRGSAEMQALLFDVDGMEELAVGMSYAKEVIVETQSLVRALDALKATEETHQRELEAQREAAEEKLEYLDQQRDAADKEKSAVEALQSDVEAELADQRELLGRVERLIADYESEKELAESELAALEREIRARASAEASESSRLWFPIDAPVSSPFGLRIHPILGTVRLHAGIDFQAGTGTPIGAAGSGTVILAGPWGGYGNTVVIDHGGGLSTLYAHQSSIAVALGESVQAGDVIGYVGSTGYSTGPHLHFETREQGIPVDPMKYLG